MNEFLMPLDTTEIWHEDAQLWDERGPLLPTPRSGGVMLNLYQGWPTMLGGKSLVAHLDQVVALNFQEGTWETLEDVTLAVARSQAGAALVPVTMFDQC